MPRITESQLRSLIREGISEVQTEMYSRNLSRRLNIKIAERKVIHLQNLINETVSVLGSSRLNEGWLDDIKSKVKDVASQFKGGPSAALGALNKAYGTRSAAEFSSGGIKGHELQKIAMSSKPVEDLMKKIEPSFQKLKNSKVIDILKPVSSLDEYINAVAEAKKSLEEFIIMNAEMDIEDKDINYLPISEKIMSHFKQAGEFIAELQEKLSSVTLDLEKLSVPSDSFKKASWKKY